MANFKFKPFEKMTEKDYATIGFKSGLEVHQQLLTGKKLFCNCPAGKFSKAYHAEILRHMRPTLSELGEYDGTALMEFKTAKDIIYRIHHDTVCTYEMDDTPPFDMNADALDKALGLGMLFNSAMVDELHIARKQYLDGSIPTGFQRTVIYCLDGRIPYKNRWIKVVQMSMEEDSCREYSDIGHERIYFPDRLGMPLIEVVTAPQMKTPRQVAEVCDIIRNACRSTGWVRTGAGATREDVNVSVRGGTRIEIKGVPSIKAIPLLTYNEAMRQYHLLMLKDELKKRGITQKTFTSQTMDVTHLVKKTSYQPIKGALKEGVHVNAIVLMGYRKLLNWQTQTNTRFSKEISDRVRVIACLTTLPNMVHSDSTEATISSAEWEKVKKVLKATTKDTIVLVWGDKRDIETAASEIIIRAREATIGIPSETRQALDDGTNGFERILPGAERMYPDTDLPPHKITNQRLTEIRSNLPINYWARESSYRKLKIPNDVITPLSISKFTTLFDQIVRHQKISPTLASVALIQFPKRFIKKGFDIKVLDEETMALIFKHFVEQKAPREAILVSMENTIKNHGFSGEAFPSPCTEKELEHAIITAENEMSNIRLYHKNNYKKVLFGLIMNDLRGRISSTAIAKSIRLDETTFKKEVINRN